MRSQPWKTRMVTRRGRYWASFSVSSIQITFSNSSEKIHLNIIPFLASVPSVAVFYVHFKLKFCMHFLFTRLAPSILCLLFYSLHIWFPLDSTTYFHLIFFSHIYYSYYSLQPKTMFDGPKTERNTAAYVLTW
jgi:hypothetical protein